MVRTPLFQKDSAFRDNDWYVAVDVALAIFVDERDGHVGVRDALAQGHTEYPLGSVLCDSQFPSGLARSDEVARGGLNRQATIRVGGPTWVPQLVCAGAAGSSLHLLAEPGASAGHDVSWDESGLTPIPGLDIYGGSLFL